MNGLFSLADHVAIALDDVIVNVRCGVHPWERHPERPNRLCISVRLFAHLQHARTAQMPIIDYDHIRDYIRSLEVSDHIDLLETIIDSITQRCFVDQRVEACFIAIRKLDIFNETRGAGIDAFRTRAQWIKGA
jgi:dihydroneopterin aldolase